MVPQQQQHRTPSGITFTYGSPYAYATLRPDEPRGVSVVGDWDGDGVTTPGVAVHDRNQGAIEWRLRNDHRDGDPHVLVHYGSWNDTVLVGDWTATAWRPPGCGGSPTSGS